MEHWYPLFKDKNPKDRSYLNITKLKFGLLTTHGLERHEHWLNVCWSILGGCNPSNTGWYDEWLYLKIRQYREWNWKRAGVFLWALAANSSPESHFQKQGNPAPCSPLHTMLSSGESFCNNKHFIHPCSGNYLNIYLPYWFLSGFPSLNSWKLEEHLMPKHGRMIEIQRQAIWLTLNVEGGHEV